MLSQHGKVLFVDEPRTIRVAVVHFASPEDRQQVFSAFAPGRGTHLEMVPVRALPPHAHAMLLGTVKCARHCVRCTASIAGTPLWLSDPTCVCAW
jgi:hypothetical protein